MSDGDSERSFGGITRRSLLRGTAVGAVLANVPLATSASGSEAAPATESTADEDAEVNLGLDFRSPTLAVSDRLADRRYVVSGERTYVVGAENGRFPAMGWHTRGEMGGVWSPPLKLLDGIWFGVDDQWLGEATTFESGYGHARMHLPSPEGRDLNVKRVDVALDDHRAVLVGLRFEAGESEESFTLKVDAHSELMSAYPWGFTTPSAKEFNLEDSVEVSDGRLLFRETGTPPVEHASEHDWAAVVGATAEPSGTETGADFRGPQDPPTVCPTDGDAPERCDDTDFGKGKGGQLRYDVTVSANEAEWVWVAVAGSDGGPEGAMAEFEAAVEDPVAALRQKVDRRRALAEKTALDVPGNERLQRAIEWGKQNLADSVQTATDLHVRDVDEGKQFPEPAGTVDRVRFVGAGFPDYPWLFATDGEYTAFANVAVGQFEPMKDHLRALRDVSRILNGDTGKVVHEVVTDGSVYFGTVEQPGNVDETAKFPSALALVWRWTGDDGLLDDLYEFAVDGMRYVVGELDSDGDGWPEGLGNVERPGMGEEKLDVTVYTIRGLYDLADLARARGDGETLGWALSHAERMRKNFEGAWWIPEVPQHADSLTQPYNERVYQRHWIGVTPMEVELAREGGSQPGLTTTERGNDALALRETPCYGGVGDDAESDQRRNEGLYHTGAPGCDEGEFAGTSDEHEERQIFTLNSAVMAVGEGNYGRLGPNQQGRFVDANAGLMLPNPDEQPGAMPEIAPSPAYGRSVDKPFVERAMVLQAWGNYGTMWPVVHQHLGVRPDVGRGELLVIPMVPPQNSELAAENVRVGDGAVAVEASVKEGEYRTTVAADASLDSLVVGHTLGSNAEVASVTLDGESVEYETRATNRGTEVLVDAPTDGEHELVVTTG